MFKTCYFQDSLMILGYLAYNFLTCGILAPYAKWDVAFISKDIPKNSIHSVSEKFHILTH